MIRDDWPTYLADHWRAIAVFLAFGILVTLLAVFAQRFRARRVFDGQDPAPSHRGERGERL